MDQTNILADVAAISPGNFQFTAALNEQLLKQETGNVVFSPFSLAVVLLMARFGARAQTGKEMDTAFKFPFSHKLARKGYHQALASILEPTEDYNVTIASRIYSQDGFQICRKYKRRVKTTFGTKTGQLNFTDSTNAAKVINDWVKATTNGKIQELVSADSLDSDTKLILASAIYFRSPWEDPFYLPKTAKSSFFVSPEKSVEVDMMQNRGSFSYGVVSELDSRLIILPYKGRRYSMYIYVPNQKDGLDRLHDGLGTTTIQAIKQKIKPGGPCDEVDVKLPRFRVESTLNLVDVLKKLGATSMFSESRANFRGIPADENAPNLYVSSVVQKAFIDVNEEGTEAAAASGMQIRPMCLPRVTYLSVDQPFHFQIIDEQSNLVLFAGAVRNPAA